MPKAMQYIKELEAAGFSRTQAEAEVKVVIDAFEKMENNMATKADLALLQERMENRFNRLEDRFQRVDERFERIDNRFAQSKKDVDDRFTQFHKHFDDRITQSHKDFDHKLSEMKFKIVTQLSLVIVSTATIGVSILTWLIKLP